MGLPSFITYVVLQGTENADDKDIFADLDRRVNVVATTEPTTYINADLDYSGVCTDPIKFWSDKYGDRLLALHLTLFLRQVSFILSTALVLHS